MLATTFCPGSSVETLALVLGVQSSVDHKLSTLSELPWNFYFD